MNKVLACVLILLCLSCGDGVNSTITDPSATSNTKVCNITVNGNGNTTACDGVVVQPPAASPLPSVDPRVTPVCGRESQRNFEQNVLQAENSIEPTQFAAEYVQSLASALARAGFTVLYGTPLPNDQIAVKNSNGFSERYDVWTVDNRPWVGYEKTCRPSEF